MLLDHVVFPQKEIEDGQFQHDGSIEDVDLLHIHRALLLEALVEFHLLLHEGDGNQCAEVDIEEGGGQGQQRRQGQHNTVPGFQVVVAEEQHQQQENGRHVEIGGHQNQAEEGPTLALREEVEAEEDEGHGCADTNLRHIVEHQEVAHIHAQKQEVLGGEFRKNVALQGNRNQGVEQKDATHIAHRSLDKFADMDEGEFDNIIVLPEVVTIILPRVFVNTNWAQASHQRQHQDDDREYHPTHHRPLVYHKGEGGRQ